METTEPMKTKVFTTLIRPDEKKKSTGSGFPGPCPNPNPNP